MSSILDALKKMEQDKAAKAAETETEIEVPFTPESATELFNQPTRHGDAAPKSPAVLIAAVAALLVIAVLASVVVSMVLMRPQTPTMVAQAPVAQTPPASVAQPVAVAPVEKPLAIAALPAPVIAPVVAAPAPAPAPMPAPIEVAVAVAPPVAPAPVVVAPASAPAPMPAPIEVAVAVAPPVAVAPAPAPVVEAPVAATPEPEPFRAPTPAPVVSMPPPPAPAPRVAAPRPAAVPVPKPKMISAPAALRDAPKDVDVATLPMMGPGEFSKYGLDGLALNMLRAPSADRPTGMAIINLNKVYPGELIPGSRARLIGVARNGIGVEIESSGEQYFIEQ